MLSDVTISFADHTLTFPGLYLLIGCLIALGLAGFIVAIVSARRIERKTTAATDILVVQLERIGDCLDRLVAQSATSRATEEPARQRAPFSPEWPVPERGLAPSTRVIPEGSAFDRVAQKPASGPALSPPQPVVSSTVKKPEEERVESNLSEPARSILFSMLGR
jgi:hypothetical protein